mmetsp:Transcript_5889/g.8077  ORF Transcript_5889/g.8077 Transcript_5889/m.8077 type:complete len:444 (+) Transcript_5889:55-1386(+)
MNEDQKRKRIDSGINPKRFEVALDPEKAPNPAEQNLVNIEDLAKQKAFLAENSETNASNSEENKSESVESPQKQPLLVVDSSENQTYLESQANPRNNLETKSTPTPIDEGQLLNNSSENQIVQINNSKESLQLQPTNQGQLINNVPENQIQLNNSKQNLPEQQPVNAGQGVSTVINPGISTANLASSLGITWEGSSLFDFTSEDPIVHARWIEQIAVGYTPLQEASYYKMRLNHLNKPHEAHVDRVMDRTLLLTYLKKRYGYRSYLEIGCRGDHNFSRVPFADKVGVDPQSGGTVRMTSDMFFATTCTRTFDLIFIDGLHESSQVLQDVQNALHFLVPNGTIVLHDCKPIFEVEGSYPFIPGTCFWNGTVWKAVTVLRTLPTIDMCVGDFDWGLGIIRRRPNTNPLMLGVSAEQITWADYESSIDQFLQPKTFLQIHDWLSLG